MDFKTLFFSWDGRSARKPYWVGIVSVEVALFVFSIVFALMNVPALVAVLMLAYPRICVISKRFHDLGRSGWWQVLPNVGTNMIIGFGGMAEAGGARGASGLFTLLSAAIEFGFLIRLGSIKGQDQKNEFGPPPGLPDVVGLFD